MAQVVALLILVAASAIDAKWESARTIRQMRSAMRTSDETTTPSCFIIHKVNRQVQGVCVEVPGGTVVCQSVDDRLMDPASECQSGGNTNNGKPANCTIEFAETMEVDGHCVHIGAREVCVSMDGSLTSLDNDCEITI